MRVLLDGLSIMPEGISGTTGGWNVINQAWQRQTSLILDQGRHVIGLTRDGFIPHLRRIALLPVMEAVETEVARSVAERRASARAALLEPAEIESLIATVAPLLRRLFSRRRSPEKVLSFIGELASAV